MHTGGIRTRFKFPRLLQNFLSGPLEVTLTVTGKIKKSPWNIMMIFPDSLRKVSFSLNSLRSIFPDPLRVPYKTKIVFPGSFEGLSVRRQHSLLLTSSKLMSRYSIICYTDQHMAGCRASLFGSNVQEISPSTPLIKGQLKRNNQTSFLSRSSCEGKLRKTSSHQQSTWDSSIP